LTDGAPLSITVCPQAKGHENRLLLIARGKRSNSFGLAYAARAVRHQRESLAKELYAIRGELGRSAGPIAWQVGGGALTRLISLGTRWVSILLGKEAGTRTQELVRFMRLAVPEWAQRDQRLRIEIHDHSQDEELASAIPFDILPLFHLGQPRPPASKPELSTLAARLLGMAGVVVRHAPTKPDLITLRREAGSGGVPVRAYCDWSLDSIADEIAQFNVLRRHFHLPEHEMWPASAPGASADPALELATRLFGGVATQIHHFACHYKADTDRAAGRERSPDCFVFRAKAAAGPFEVKLGELAERHVNLAAERVLPSPGPLLVLNACDTASQVDGTSLAQWFLDAGFRAVLGSETRVPDRGAACFSQLLYTRLAEGLQVGEALRKARWDMLERYNNPLGLFFTLHGRAELYVPPLPANMGGPRPPAALRAS
jgi:hypothetical protein